MSNFLVNAMQRISRWTPAGITDRPAMTEARPAGPAPSDRSTPRKPAPRSDEQSKRTDLIMVCPHLGDGGVQRVVSMLANAWSRKGRKICIITLFKDEVAYPLDPDITVINLYELRHSGILMWLLEKFRLSCEWVKEMLRRLKERFLSCTGAENPPWWLRVLGFCYWRVRHVYKLIRWLFLRSPMARMFWHFYLPLFIRVRALRQIIQRSGAPVVIGLCGSTNILTVLACKTLPSRVIISERNDPARQLLDRPWNDLRPRTYGRADVVTANSRGALKSLEQYVSPGKLAFVPNPLAPPAAEETGAPTLLTASPFILIVARLHWQKAHDVLLTAFSALPASMQHWRLAIVGRGDREPDLRRQADALGIGQRVDWCGQVDNPFAYYRAAEMFVLPSRHEGTPNALLEAMSCGLPCIISDASPGPLELIDHDRTGLVVPVDQAAALAGAMELLATDPETRQRLSRAARERVSEYSLPNAISAWEKLIGWQPAPRRP